MSSSSTSHKRVASGDGTSEKKRKRIEEYGEKSAALIDDSDDEEDTNTAAPVDEAVVEAPEAEARFLRAKTQAIELEKERKLLEKETSEWRSKTYALRFACRHVDKNMAIVDKIVKENGGASSQAEADYLEVMSVFFAQNLVQQAFPGRATPSLGPFRSDEEIHVDGKDNDDESSHPQEADDEDRSFSSSGHEDSQAAIESEKERGHEFDRAQEPGHRASASNPGKEHQDALFAYIERQRHKLSKSAREDHGPRAKSERH
ncbi:hypothetical protein KC363_g3535 [Hortaea werneckii]|nr:hypothetical protein KC325_g4140 [Hortaea werneckii]KAI6994069.1 hypothetical protein KC359_g4820 [Hortaea werneckii]KAI7145845.1 hypothetical protein KC344_g4147 [Hortaea werneckii]KAI7174729.1 hypothetical protein KC360_g4116 [Hortaea werneckii]KAI7192008.1 hypothetical protein KC363_g3535 [Hortaea werneckii]